MTDVVQCWCANSIPPWSVFHIADVLNPSALAEPTFVVKKGFSFPYTTAFHINRATSASAIVEYWWRSTHLRPDVLTNGIIAVPARTVFSAKPLNVGIHWLAYHEDAAFDFQWFSPLSDQWAVIDTAQNPLGLAGFRQVGYRDEIQKCIPVIMEPDTWVHQFIWGDIP